MLHKVGGINPDFKRCVPYLYSLFALGWSGKNLGKASRRKSCRPKLSPGFVQTSKRLACTIPKGVVSHVKNEFLVHFPYESIQSRPEIVTSWNWISKQITRQVTESSSTSYLTFARTGLLHDTHASNKTKHSFLHEPTRKGAHFFSNEKKKNKADFRPSE